MPEELRPEIRWFRSATAARAPGHRTPWRSLPQLLVEYADGPGWRVDLPGRRGWTAQAGEGFVILPQTRHRLTMTGGSCSST